MKVTFSLEQIYTVAKQILEQDPNKIILFDGEMGVGKTTLIKAITKQLGVIDVASSPTFSIVNEYVTNKNEIVYHFDFYRIKNESEAYDMGVEDYFYSNNYCFIEWSEKITNLIPEKHTTITIEVLADGNRKLQLKNSL